MPALPDAESARARRDIYRESTEAVLAALERGTIAWCQPWSAQRGIPPRKAASGRAYRGVNFLQLSLAGYESPWWLTFSRPRTATPKCAAARAA
jgi:antirestriction protein ArdC